MFQSPLERQVGDVETSLVSVVGSIDPDGVPASEATRLVERLDRIARAASAARTLLARRMADSLEWQRKAVVISELDRLTDEIFHERRNTGVREARDTYVWDALVRMAERSRDGSGSVSRSKRPRNPRHLGLLRVDVEALRRGQVAGEELCEITGVPPDDPRHPTRGSPSTAEATEPPPMAIDRTPALAGSDAA